MLKATDKNETLRKYTKSKEDLIPLALDIYCRLNPNVHILKKTLAVVNKELEDKVHVISGGGAGVDLQHVNYVCKGMLSAAICGPHITTSPTYQDILETIKSIANLNGVLLIVQNYSGDVMNFELAAELARAKKIKTRVLHVKDDVTNKTGEKRGLAGTVLLSKVLGAASFEMTLERLHEFGEEICDNIHTVRVSLLKYSTGDIPKLFNMNEGVEIGVGISGEKGTKTSKFRSIEEIFEEVYIDLRHLLLENDEIVLLLNNLGHLNEMEMNILVKPLIQKFRNEKINIRRLIQGTILSTISCHGFSVSIFKLKHPYKNKIVDLIDYPIDCPNWKVIHLNEEKFTQEMIYKQPDFKARTRNADMLETKLKLIVKEVFKILITEPAFFTPDISDFKSLAKNFEYVLERVNLTEDFPKSLEIIATHLSKKLDGTIGSLILALFLKLSQRFRPELSSIDKEDVSTSFQFYFVYLKRLLKCHYSYIQYEPHIDNLWKISLLLRSKSVQEIYTEANNAIKLMEEDQNLEILQLSKILRSVHLNTGKIFKIEILEKPEA